MDSEFFAEDKNNQQTLCVKLTDQLPVSALTRDLCINHNDRFVYVPQFSSRTHTTRDNTSFYCPLGLELPWNTDLNFEVEKIVIHGLPLENKIDLCFNGLAACQNQVTRCLPRGKPEDPTVFLLTKRGKKMMDHYRTITDAELGINIHKLTCVFLKVPFGFKTNQLCTVEYCGFKKHNSITYPFFTFNCFSTITNPFRKHLIENCKIESDQSFPLLVVNKNKIVASTESFKISDTSFVVYCHFDNKCDDIIKRYTTSNDTIFFVIPSTNYRQHLTIETKYYEEIEWHSGKSVVESHNFRKN